jgi:3-hydroxybutyryl-CoA dehydrogenase
MSQNWIKSIAVIGAGTMGQGIAQVCATAGYKVLLYDVQSELITNGINAIRKSFDIAVQKGKLTQEQRLAAAANITSVSDFRNLQVELVIEAVIEKLEVKQKIFCELEKINDKDCVLASNTSSIPITQIASALKHQNRFAGLHFFNPAPAMKLVEVICGASTSDDVIRKLTAFSHSLGKTTVAVKDSPGFIVNRVARHFYVESLKLLEENVADVQSVDQLMRSAGFKMGPFELMDMIGVDINFSVTSSMYQAFHQEPKFRPSRIQQQKVDAGHLGRKSGKGFYDYSDGQNKT